MSRPTGFDLFADLFHGENLSKLTYLFSMDEESLNRIFKKFKKDVHRYPNMSEEDLVLYFTDRARFNQIKSRYLIGNKSVNPVNAHNWNPSNEGHYGEHHSQSPNRSRNRMGSRANGSNKRSRVNMGSRANGSNTRSRANGSITKRKGSRANTTRSRANRKTSPTNQQLNNLGDPNKLFNNV